MLFFRVLVCIIVVFLLTMPLVFANPPPDNAPNEIIINLPGKILELYNSGNLAKTYSIAIGKPSTPTPQGNFSILEKQINPLWYPPQGGDPVPSGPYNPLGYRWMEFAPSYGIHGTNAPWSIGSAVSHGCVRMMEQDAEDLYSLVQCGTPVKIIYDRVKIDVTLGEASIIVYPDVYNCKAVNLEEVKKQLAAAGLNGIITDKTLQDFIYQATGQKQHLANVSKIRFNDKLLSDYAININGYLYIPADLLPSLFNNVVWNEKSQLITGTNYTTKATCIGNQYFIPAKAISNTFGCQVSFKASENTLEINMLTAALNGRVFTHNVQEIDGMPAISLLELAKTLEQGITKTAENEYMYQGKILPVVYCGSQPYIKINKINEYFQAYVYWNQAAKNIELTYPFKINGGND